MIFGLRESPKDGRPLTHQPIIFIMLGHAAQELALLHRFRAGCGMATTLPPLLSGRICECGGRAEMLDGTAIGWLGGLATYLLAR